MNDEGRRRTQSGPSPSQPGGGTPLLLLLLLSGHGGSGPPAQVAWPARQRPASGPSYVAYPSPTPPPWLQPVYPPVPPLIVEAESDGRMRVARTVGELDGHFAVGRLLPSEIAAMNQHAPPRSLFAPDLLAPGEEQSLIDAMQGANRELVRLGGEGAAVPLEGALRQIGRIRHDASAIRRAGNTSASTAGGAFGAPLINLPRSASGAAASRVTAAGAGEKPLLGRASIVDADVERVTERFAFLDRLAPVP